MATPTLALRCTDHPTYMAKRKPTADCKACRQLWSLVQTIPGVVVLSDAEVDKLFTRPIEPPKMLMPDLVVEAKPYCSVKDIQGLVDWLNEQFGETYVYTWEKGRKFYKIFNENFSGGGHSAYAFVAKEDLYNKTLGSVRAGAVLRPASYGKPAKHERAYIFDKETWAGAFSAYGVAYMK